MAHSERHVLDLQAFWTAKPASQCDNIFIHSIHHTKSDTRSETFDHAPILHRYWQLRWNITGLVLYTIFILSPTTDTTSVAVIKRAREKREMDTIELQRRRNIQLIDLWSFQSLIEVNSGFDWEWHSIFIFFPLATPLPPTPVFLTTSNSSTQYHTESIAHYHIHVELFGLESRKKHKEENGVQHKEAQAMFKFRNKGQIFTCFSFSSFSHSIRMLAFDFLLV